MAVVSFFCEKIETLVPHKAIVWKEPARRRAHTVEVVKFRLAFRNPVRTKGCIASSLDGMICRSFASARIEAGMGFLVGSLAMVVLGEATEAVHEAQIGQAVRGWLRKRAGLE